MSARFRTSRSSGGRGQRVRARQAAPPPYRRSRRLGAFEAGSGVERPTWTPIAYRLRLSRLDVERRVATSAVGGLRRRALGRDRERLWSGHCETRSRPRDDGVEQLAEMDVLEGPDRQSSDAWRSRRRARRPRMERSSAYSIPGAERCSCRARVGPVDCTSSSHTPPGQKRVHLRLEARGRRPNAKAS